MSYSSCIDCGIEKTSIRGSQRSPRCKSCSKKGNTNCFGKHHSQEVCEKLRLAQTGKTYSLESRRKISRRQGGDGDLENRRYPGLGRWTASVKRTFPCCVICRSAEALEAHHIAAKAAYPQLATFLLNGVTLCKPCHKEIHLGKN